MTANGHVHNEEADLDPWRRVVRACTAHHLEMRLGRDSNVEVILVARENFALFTPMLHEVAGSDVADTDSVQPLRKMLRRTRIGIAEIQSIDLATKTVRIMHHDLP